MKTTPIMQRIITQLAERHGRDFTKPGAHLRLDMPNFDRLTIENIGPNQISVAHYFEQNSDLIADPEIVFFTGSLVWTPLAIGQVMTGWREVAWLNADGIALDRYLPLAHKEVAVFAEIWAKNLIDQGWLTDAIVYQRPSRLTSGEVVCNG